MPDSNEIVLRQKQRIRRRRFGAQAPATYATDTFTRADSAVTLGTADSGSAWTARVGTWGITSNKAYCVTGANGQIATIACAGPAGSVSASLVTDAINTHVNGIMLRFVDVNNYLIVTAFSATVAIGTNVAGVFNSRASGAGTLGGLTGTGANTFTLSATVVNNVVTAFVNSIQIAQYTLVAGEISAFGASANVGLSLSWSSGTNTAATADNFVATA